MSELVNHYFHTFDEAGVVKQQGQVIDEIAPGFFLVELFSWFTGCANGRRVVSVDTMTGWNFYTDADEMNEYYAKVTRYAD